MGCGVVVVLELLEDNALGEVSGAGKAHFSG
jgi:hypothetical protein